MNKGQFVETLANQFEGDKRAAKHALEAVVDTITRELVRGEKVAITGFGAFVKVARPARTVRNPRTGETSRAKKTAVAKFRPGAELKAVVSGEKKLPKATAAKKSTTAKKSTSASGTKKTAAKSTAKRSTAKRSTAKKSTAKKSTAKKSSARRS